MFKPAVAWLFYGVALTLVGVIIVNLGTVKSRRNVTRWLGHGLKMAIIIMVILAAGGFTYLRQQPTRHEKVITDSEVTGWQVDPKDRISKGVIYYLGNKGQEVEDFARSILCPLAEKGWCVICFPQPDFRMDALEQNRRVVDILVKSAKYKHKSWFYAGDFQGGTSALLLAADADLNSNLRGVAVMDAMVDSPFPEASPWQKVHRLQVPVCLVYPSGNQTVPVEEGGKLYEHFSKYGLVVEFHTQPYTIEIDSRQGRLWVEKVNDFCENKRVMASE